MTTRAGMPTRRELHEALSDLLWELDDRLPSVTRWLTYQRAWRMSLSIDTGRPDPGLPPRPTPQPPRRAKRRKPRLMLLRKD